MWEAKWQPKSEIHLQTQKNKITSSKGEKLTKHWEYEALTGCTKYTCLLLSLPHPGFVKCFPLNFRKLNYMLIVVLNWKQFSTNAHWLKVPCSTHSGPSSERLLYGSWKDPGRRQLCEDPLAATCEWECPCASSWVSFNSFVLKCNKKGVVCERSHSANPPYF